MKDPYDLSTIVEHSAYLASTISALYIELLVQSLKDVLIQPRRSKLITGFYDMQKAAYATGAISCGISRSGPTMFALVKKQDDANAVAKTIQDKFKQFNLKSNS